MRWLKAIFGSRKVRRDRPGSPSFAGTRSGTVTRRREARPYDYVSSGLEAWHAEDHERAEQFLRQGIDAYRSHEPDGVDFALGRLGAFLLAQERVDEAARVLDSAISLGTDIPAIWSDYLEIMATAEGPRRALWHQTAVARPHRRSGAALGRASCLCTASRPWRRLRVCACHS